MHWYVKKLIAQAKANAEADPLDTLIGTVFLVLLGSVVAFVATVCFAFSIQALLWAFTNTPCLPGGGV